MKKILFKIIKAFLMLVYPKVSLDGGEKLSEGEVIVVANHTQLHSPIIAEFYFPTNFYTWCAHEMMELKEVPSYAFNDFWRDKRKSVRWLFKIISFIIAPLAVIVFNGARTIPVYHGKKVITTFKKTVSTLENGGNIVIFPEYAKEYNNIVYDFHDRFIDVAKVYFGRTGRSLKFLPAYVSPTLKKVVFGDAIVFNPENDLDDERDRIKEYLMSSITSIAKSLPRHTVVPYRNIPKKDYPTNKE